MVAYYRTYDTFNIQNEEKRNKLLKQCLRAALKCGLNCGYAMDGTRTKLYMTGKKKQFVMYYLITVLRYERLTDGVRMVMRCISWK